jgi:methyl-accepting chemotaxis protein
LKQRGAIISEVRALNEQTVQKFIETLQKHERQLDRVDALKKVLQDATGEFAEHVTGYNTINKDLKVVSQETNSALQMLAQSSKTLKQSQDAFNQIAGLAMDKIHLLADSNNSQKELWEDIGDSMEQYKRTFSTIESSAAAILANISDHLQNFSRATQTHLNQTVTVANDHINTAVGQLSVSIESLSDRLEDLTEIVDRIPRDQ